MKKLKIMLVVVVLLLVVNITSADTFGTGDNQFTIDFVEISGDTNSASGRGIVNNDYRMGKFEISNDQYAEFTTNNAHWTSADVPANNLSWFEAAQFVNYLNTSMGHQAAYKFTGNTYAVWESGDAGYNASNPFRNSNAYYFLPTENEWVKAAYWNGTSMQSWSTPDDYFPIEDVEANYGNEYDAQPWDVGSGSEELNGTFDMMGNLWEWMESPYGSGDYLSGSYRGIRGGLYLGYSNYLSSASRFSGNPGIESFSIGFRVASVPEPCSLVLFGLGGLVLRRRKA